MTLFLICRNFAPFARIAVVILCAGLCVAPFAPARAEMEPMRVAKLRTLDKITARTMTFEADVGSTVKFGPLFIKVRSCQKAPPIDQPEAAAFLQIWENGLKDKKPQWVFSGWMFASSPGLSPMDHPIYDVWVLDCLEYKTGKAPATEAPLAPEEEQAVKDAAAEKPASPAADETSVAPAQENAADDGPVIEDGDDAMTAPDDSASDDMMMAPADLPAENGAQ